MDFGSGSPSLFTLILVIRIFMVSKTNNDNLHDEYTVLARKYRPKDFNHLIGQETLVKTLSGAFKRDRLAHAYILTGVRGVGKTSTARILAKGFNCINISKNDENINPCNDCKSCSDINLGNHIDVIEMDAASHTGVDNIRDLIDGVGYKPLSSKYRVYIIDEVHMLSKGAFNALLKTLEEPPDHVKFIFATTEIRKVPVTVLSRCQRFDLKRVSLNELIEHLVWVCNQEKILFDNEVLKVIAKVSGGSVRDALSILDQALAISDGKLNLEDVNQMLALTDKLTSILIFKEAISGNIQNSIDLYNKVIISGGTTENILNDVLEIIHLISRLVIIEDKKKNFLIDKIPEGEQRELKALTNLKIPDLARSWQIILKGIEEIRLAPNAEIAGEMILIRLAYASSLGDPSKLLQKLKESMINENEEKPITNDPVDYNSDNNLKNMQNSGINKGLEKQISTPSNFMEFVELFKEKGEMLLYSQIKSSVHLVSFNVGEIVIRISGHPEKTLSKEISSKISEWTGIKWNVNQVENGGNETINGEKLKENNEKIEMAKNSEEMKKVLQAFPSAKLKKVTDRQNDNENENINIDFSNEEEI